MTDWLLQTLVTFTFLALGVLALRAPVARMFGAGWAYALWAVPALRLVLPPLPQLTPELTLPPLIVFIPAMSGGGAAPLPADAGSGQWMPLLLATWAGGAVIFLVLQWLAYRDFLHRLDSTSRPARPPSYGGISTSVSESVDGPIAVGLFDRRIVIPSDFSRRYSPAERRLAMEHELIHHRRFDIGWNMAALVILALNWFNPIAWLAFRAFRADQELSCDAAVAARVSSQERHDYALALVKSASRPGLIAACPLNHAGQLKQRLRMMRGHRVSMGRSVGGFAALLGLALTGFAVGGPVLSQEPEPRQIVYVTAPEAVVLASATTAARPAAPRLASMPRALVARPRAAADPLPAPAATMRPAQAAEIAPLALFAQLPEPASAPAPFVHPRPNPVPAAAPAPTPQALAMTFKIERIARGHREARVVRVRSVKGQPLKLLVLGPEDAARHAHLIAALERALSRIEPANDDGHHDELKAELERELARVRVIADKGLQRGRLSMSCPAPVGPGTAQFATA